MEYNQDQRMFLATIQIAGRINISSMELVELIYFARLYLMGYTLHLQASLDERLIRMEAEIHHIIREGRYNLREALAERLRRQATPPNSLASSPHT